MLMLAESDEIYYYSSPPHQAHGSGPAYAVITVTLVRDGTAWERVTR